MSQGSDTTRRAGRFGPRYGTRIRRRVANVERVQFDTHRCPQCLTGELDRVSTSIWACRKCDHKFAGGAYQPRTESFGMAQAPEEELEEVSEELEDELEPDEETVEPAEPGAEPEESEAEPEEAEPAEPEDEADEAEPEPAEDDEDDDEPRDIESLFE